MTELALDQLIKDFGIGLTGGVATGKSTVSEMVRRQGTKVFDADQLARAATAKGSAALAAIVSEFGAGVLSADGGLDRSALAAIVFNNPGSKRRLEEIVHPEIARLFRQKLVEVGLSRAPELFFYEAALLVEAGKVDEFRELWITDCAHETQVSRLVSGRSIDRTLAKQIIASQLPQEAKRKYANVIIGTDGPLSETLDQVVQNLERLKNSS